MKRNTYSLLVALVFLLLGASVIAHHELWRDEIQSWLLARDSSSVRELLSAQKYEGHPALWQLMLYLLTRVFSTPAAMQCLHLLIATTTVYLFVRFSPFTLLQRLLFSFGYFPFYEYSVVSRSYGLVLLLLTLFCCLYPRRDRHFLSVAFTLVLLSHAHALGLIVALVLFAALWCDRLIARPGSVAGRCPPGMFYAGSALFMVGVIAAVIQIRPPIDTGIATEWQLGLHYRPLVDTGKALVDAYLPVPRFGLHYWNNPFLIESRFFPLNVISYLTVPGYVLFVLYTMRRTPVAALFFVVSTFGLLLFFYTKYLGYTRHHGILFACLIVSIWMYRSDDSAAPEVPTNPRDQRWRRLFATSLTLLLTVHVAAAAIASTLEYRYPFSAAAAVADYLHRNGHDESLLVGAEDYSTTAILGFSVQKKIYYPQSQRWGSYIIWNQSRLRAVSDEEIIQEARALPRRAGQHVLLVLNRSLDDDLVRKYGVSPLGFFSGAVVADENFHLYQCDRAGALPPIEEAADNRAPGLKSVP